MTLDRVVASVEGVPITQSDVQREYQLEVFLDTGQAPSAPPDGPTLKAALAKLIDRKILAGQLENYRSDEVAIQLAAGRRMSEIRKRSGSEAAFQAALQKLGINESQLRDDLAVQERILAMIDGRLRPAAAIEPKDVEDYYKKEFLPAYARVAPGSAPPLAQVRDKIREILVQKKIDELLDEWLTRLRKDSQVEVLPDDSRKEL